MRSIRVGFFEDFKGADTLLIDVDAEGLRGLIAWLRNVMSSDRRVLLSACPGVTLQSTLRVDVFRSPDDIGLVRAAEWVFVWQRSEDGWTDVVEKLAARAKKQSSIAPLGSAPGTAPPLSSPGPQS